MIQVNSDFPFPVAPFIQASDTTNQEPSTTNPTQVTLNTTDTSFGIVNSGGNFRISEGGIYMIVVGGQVDESQVQANVNVDLWLRKNSTDIPNTGVRNFVTNTTDTKVVMTNCLIRLAVGDVIKVFMAIDVTGKGAGLRALTPAGQAAIPSIIFSMYKISN